MIGGLTVGAIMPALNEAGVIGPTLDSLPGAIDSVWVGDNGSRDGTAAEAAARGAHVVGEPRRGYGSACQAVLREMERLGPPDVVVFIDADGSQPVDELDALIGPIASGDADFVIGYRRFKDSPFHVSLGNRLACLILRLTTGHSFRDLGPFRAIRYENLRALDLRDRDYGWNVEMQARALSRGLRIVEIPVSHRKRTAGRSKISGSVTGTVRAGAKIISTAFIAGSRAGRSRRAGGDS